MDNYYKVTECVEKREKYLDFLKFDKLEIQNTPTDFMVNGKKVQEKVGGYDRYNNSLNAYLSSNNGKNMKMVLENLEHIN